MAEVVEAQVVQSPAPTDLGDSRLYINRELSLLEFQRRVLEEAQDKKNPLLERVKFLAIVGSNLDEFFMVRVSGLRKQVESGVVDVAPDGLTPAEQLAEIRKVTTRLLSTGLQCLTEDLLPELDSSGIHVKDYSALTKAQKTIVDHYFQDVVFPVLTPLAVDPGHPFPHISNLSLNLAVLLTDKKGAEHFARIKVPGTLPRLLPIKRSSGSVRKDGTVPFHHYFVWLEQVIAANLDKLFPGMTIRETYPFRVTRDADMLIQELEASDLLETTEQSVRRRRFGSVVNLSITSAMPARIRNLLVENLEMDSNDIFVFDNPLGLSALFGLHAIDRRDLKETPFKPAVPVRLREYAQDSNIFSAIRRGDILIHHPYDSFTPVIDFMTAAARDPDVLAIKQTLYRVGRDSPVVEALLEARENGKQVAVLVELKARFDEESNINWARTLEREGVHVVYGLLGLKTHSKIALVIRKEGESIRRYMHLATGNYNSVTAHLYEDIGMFTCDDDIGADATDLFNYLTGYSSKVNYRKLLVAPVNLRQGMDALIRREIEHHKKGRPARLVFKMNSLVDALIIRSLYEASQAGLKVDLIVRGMCCLRPGIPGISENIRVISVVGRFLEHSRVFYFENGGQEQIYLGSADLMPRNINRRVEVLFPVTEPRLIRYLRDDVLDTYLKDNVKARLMKKDGTFGRVRPKSNEPEINVQEWLLQFNQTSQK